MGPAKNAVSGLKSELASVVAERNILHDTLCQIQKGIRVDIESRLSRQAQNYEVRLTELHSVIAELKKQLDGQQRNRILEDSAEEEEEMESNCEHEDDNSNGSIETDVHEELNDGDMNLKRRAEIQKRDSSNIIAELRNKPETVIIGYEKETRSSDVLDLSDKALDVCYIQGEEYLFSETSLDPHFQGNKTGNSIQPGRQFPAKETTQALNSIKTKQNSTQNEQKNKNLGPNQQSRSGRIFQEKIPQSERKEKVVVEAIRVRVGGDLASDKEADIVAGKNAASLALLCQEVAQVREEHSSIRQSLSEKDGELNKTKSDLKNIARERDFLKNKVIELELMLSSSPQRCTPELSCSQISRDLQQRRSGQDDVDLCKVAERVKLKPSLVQSQSEILNSPKLSPTTQGNILNNNLDTRQNETLIPNHFHSKPKFHSQLTFITGTELVKSVDTSCSTRLIEYLVRPLQQESRIREMGTVFNNSASGNQEVNEDKVREFAIETERLQTCLEHLRAQNDVLTLNLNAAKEHADHLTGLLGKYESNNVALHMTLGYSDQAIQGYDVLVALLESELGQLLANCRAAGFGSAGSMVVQTEEAKRAETDDSELVQDLLQRAYENRFVAESAARSLLTRNIDSPNSENNNSSGLMMLRFNHQHPSPPWEETSSCSQTLSSASSLGDHNSPSSNHSPSGDVLSSRRGNLEQGIRDLIIQLKTNTEYVRSTVQYIENDWNLEPEEKPPLSPCELIEARRLDLETAVLMQELMAMREERAELRASLFHGEKDRVGLEMKLESCDTQTLAYKARINYLATELKEYQNQIPFPTIDNITNSDSEEAATDGNANRNQNQNKVQVLKAKIEELLSTLEKVSEASTGRERQNGEMTMELKQANGMLIQTLESLKRKYQARIGKMEEQILAIMHRHTTTVKLYKEKIYFLEKELQR